MFKVCSSVRVYIFISTCSSDGFRSLMFNTLCYYLCAFAYFAASVLLSLCWWNHQTSSKLTLRQKQMFFWDISPLHRLISHHNNNNEPLLWTCEMSVAYFKVRKIPKQTGALQLVQVVELPHTQQGASDEMQMKGGRRWYMAMKEDWIWKRDFCLC